MRAGGRVYQLSSDPHTSSSFADRAFEHVTHAQFARYLLHVHRLAFVAEAAVSSDYKEPGQPRNRRGDFLNHTINEIFLLDIAGHVLKREHSYRRLVRKRKGWRRFNR